jgi:hypothetical protein
MIMLRSWFGGVGESEVWDGGLQLLGHPALAESAPVRVEQDPPQVGVRVAGPADSRPGGVSAGQRGLGQILGQAAIPGDAVRQANQAGPATVRELAELRWRAVVHDHLPPPTCAEDRSRPNSCLPGHGISYQHPPYRWMTTGRTRPGTTSVSRRLSRVPPWRRRRLPARRLPLNQQALRSGRL